MSRVKTLKVLFKRYRRPGDIIFAWAVLLVSLFLLSQIHIETAYNPGDKLFSHACKHLRRSGWNRAIGRCRSIRKRPGQIAARY